MKRWQIVASFEQEDGSYGCSSLEDAQRAADAAVKRTGVAYDVFECTLVGTVEPLPILTAWREA